MRRREVHLHWRDRLDAALVEGGLAVSGEHADPGVRARSDGRAGSDDRVRINLFQVGAPCAAVAMAPDPARYDDEGSFREAVFTARREVALVGLRAAVQAGSGQAGSGQTVSGRDGPGRDSSGRDSSAWAVVDSTLRDPGSLRRGVQEWLERLDPPGVAALRAGAVSWVVDARALGARHGEPEWHEPRALLYAPVRPEDAGTGRGVRSGRDLRDDRTLPALTAQVDAVRPGPDGVHLLLVRPRSSVRDRRLAGRVALLWMLVRGEEPCSVVLGMRDTLHRERFVVDDELTDSAIREAVSDIRAALDPVAAPRSPGGHCAHCRLLQDCTDGRSHLGALARRWQPPWGQEAVASGPEPTM